MGRGKGPTTDPYPYSSAIPPEGRCGVITTDRYSRGVLPVHPTDAGGDASATRHPLGGVEGAYPKDSKEPNEGTSGSSRSVTAGATPREPVKVPHASLPLRGEGDPTAASSPGRRGDRRNPPGTSSTTGGVTDTPLTGGDVPAIVALSTVRLVSVSNEDAQGDVGARKIR